MYDSAEKLQYQGSPNRWMLWFFITPFLSPIQELNYILLTFIWCFSSPDMEKTLITTTSLHVITVRELQKSDRLLKVFNLKFTTSKNVVTKNHKMQ